MNTDISSLSLSAIWIELANKGAMIYKNIPKRFLVQFTLGELLGRMHNSITREIFSQADYDMTDIVVETMAIRSNLPSFEGRKQSLLYDC